MVNITGATGMHMLTFIGSVNMLDLVLGIYQLCNLSLSIPGLSLVIPGLSLPVPSQSQEVPGKSYPPTPCLV